MVALSPAGKEKELIFRECEQYPKVAIDDWRRIPEVGRIATGTDDSVTEAQPSDEATAPSEEELLVVVAAVHFRSPRRRR